MSKPSLPHFSLVKVSPKANPEPNLALFLLIYLQTLLEGQENWSLLNERGHLLKTRTSTFSLTDRRFESAPKWNLFPPPW